MSSNLSSVYVSESVTQSATIVDPNQERMTQGPRDIETALKYRVWEIRRFHSIGVVAAQRS